MLRKMRRRIRFVRQTMSDFAAASLATAPLAPPRFRLQPDRRAEAAKRRRMLRDLDLAISNDAPSLQFWPRLSLHTGQLVAAELSWRWSHRRHGVLPGTALAEIAGNTPLGARLANWALHRACHAAQHWQQACVLSVRIPDVMLPAAELATHIEWALTTSGLPPQRLEIRLGEAQLAAMGAADLVALSALRDLGISIALAQFGCGEVSLGLLRRVPLSNVILAADLLRHLPRDRDDGSILHAIVHAAQGLGIATTGCGVERAAQRDFLRDLGCEAAQGPLLSAASAGVIQLTPC